VVHLYKAFVPLPKQWAQYQSNLQYTEAHQERKVIDLANENVSIETKIVLFSLPFQNQPTRLFSQRIQPWH
jgi:hypothetical protein